MMWLVNFVQIKLKPGEKISEELNSGKVKIYVDHLLLMYL